MITIPAHYQLTPKDLAGVSLEWRSNMVTVGPAALAFLSGFVGASVPNDRVWAITTITYEVTPGAAQFCTFADLIEQFADSTASTDRVIASWDFNHPAGAAAAGCHAMANVLYFVRPGSSVQAQASFNAGAAANVFTATVSGYLIPRGNIQFAG